MKKKTIGTSIKSPPTKGMFFLFEKDLFWIIILSVHSRLTYCGLKWNNIDYINFVLWNEMIRCNVNYLIKSNKFANETSNNMKSEKCNHYFWKMENLQYCFLHDWKKAEDKDTRAKMSKNSLLRELLCADIIHGSTRAIQIGTIAVMSHLARFNSFFLSIFWKSHLHRRLNSFKVIWPLKLVSKCSIINAKSSSDMEDIFLFSNTKVTLSSIDNNFSNVLCNLSTLIYPVLS